MLLVIIASRADTIRCKNFRCPVRRLGGRPVFFTVRSLRAMYHPVPSVNGVITTSRSDRTILSLNSCQHGVVGCGARVDIQEPYNLRSSLAHRAAHNVSANLSFYRQPSHACQHASENPQRHTKPFSWSLSICMQLVSKNILLGVLLHLHLGGPSQSVGSPWQKEQVHYDGSSASAKLKKHKKVLPRQIRNVP